MLSIEKLDKEKLKILLGRLNRQYDHAYPLDDAQGFFVGVADYVKVVENSDYLSAIVKGFILPERDKKLAEIDEVSKQVVKEVEKTLVKVKGVIKDNKIESENVKHELDEYMGFTEGRIKIHGYGNYATHLSDMVRDIIIAIKSTGFEKEAHAFAEINPQGIIINWKISETEKKLDNLLTRFEEHKQISIWNAWEQVWWVYTMIHNKYEYWDKINKDKFMDTLNFGMLAGDMKKVLDGKVTQRDYPYFQIPEFKRHFFRVHEILQAEVEALLATDDKTTKKIESKSEPQPTEKWYVPESGTGLIKGKKFNLTEGKDKFKLFNKLVEVKKLLRQDVINVLGLPDEANDKTNRSLNTYKINEIVKELRKTTRLDKTELINNGCNITLLVKVEIKSPNTT